VIHVEAAAATHRSSGPAVAAHRGAPFGWLGWSGWTSGPAVAAHGRAPFVVVAAGVGDFTTSCRCSSRGSFRVVEVDFRTSCRCAWACSLRGGGGWGGGLHDQLSLRMGGAPSGWLGGRWRESGPAVAAHRGRSSRVFQVVGGEVETKGQDQLSLLIGGAPSVVWVRTSCRSGWSLSHAGPRMGPHGVGPPAQQHCSLGMPHSSRVRPGWVDRLISRWSGRQM
jgi:hypothetical protein